MATQAPTESTDLDLARLEQQLDELIRVCDQLREENRSLRAKHHAVMAERSSLIEKNEMARARVEAMITRLRSMERVT